MSKRSKTPPEGTRTPERWVGMPTTITFSREEIQIIYLSLKASVHGTSLVWKFAGLFHDIFTSKNSPQEVEVELDSTELWSIQEAVPAVASTKNQPDAGLQVHLKIIRGLMELKAELEMAEAKSLLEEVGHGQPRKGHHKTRRKASNRAAA